MKDGQLIKEGHSKVSKCFSHHLEVPDDDIAPFYEAVKRHAALGHCLQKGNTDQPLEWESRAGHSNPNEETRLLCLDLDGVKGISSVWSFLEKLGLGRVDHVVQYSSSMGVDPGKGLSAHIFVLLDRPTMPEVLKEWLTNRNFALPELEQGIKLSSNSNALRWTLDRTTCQSDKLIYISPPLCLDGVVDKFEGERIALVRGDRRTATLDASLAKSAANAILIERKHDALREAAGLEKKKWNRSKSKGGEEYMPNPDPCTVTGVDVQKEHTYLNLNGGDSWGYWHYTENPRMLYNFKGEKPAWLWDIVPEYWRSLRREHSADVKRGGKVYLGFVDFTSSSYWRGTWDEKSCKLELSESRSKEQVWDYMRENGQPALDPLPTFRMVFDPSTFERVKVAEKWVNLYEPSEYALRAAEVTPVAEMPEAWAKVIKHVVAYDEETYERFLNWAACLVQLRVRLGSNWVFQGVHGTGKGLVYWELLQPLLGEANTTIKKVEEMASEFTGFLDKKLLVFVDDQTEMDAVTRTKMKQAESVIKSATSEKKISVRHMRQAHRDVENFVNIIMTANYHVDAVAAGDRRPNIAPFQHEKLPEPGEAGVKALQDARWEAFCYLMTRKIDREMARQGLDNKAKRDHAERSTNSFTRTCQAIHEGDYAYFESYVDTDYAKSLPNHVIDLFKEYNELVKRMRAWPNLSRQEMAILFARICGGMDGASGRLTRSLANNQITLKQQHRPAIGEEAAKTVYGFPVKWKFNEKEKQA